MLNVYRTQKCLDSEDKRLILRIIEDEIDMENEEIDKVIKRHRFTLPTSPKDHDEYRSMKIHSILIRSHEDFKRKVENLKNRINEYSECDATTRITPETEEEYIGPPKRTLTRL